MYRTKQKDTFKLPAALIEYCIMRGWDPPGKEFEVQKTNWQPYGGKPVRTGTAGSVQGGAKLAPDQPPGRSSSSVPAATSGLLGAFGGMPSLSGNQCFSLAGQRVCPRCGVVGGQNKCDVPILNTLTGLIEYKPAGEAEAQANALMPTNPLVADIGGEMGRITRMRGGETTLRCGGTMTMSTAEVSAVMGATHLAIATEQSRDVRVYARTGSSFNYLHTVRLGRKVCGVDKDDATRPIHQYLFFTTEQPFVAFRAIQPLEEAQEQAGEGAVVYNTADEEKYVLVRPAVLIAGREDPPGCEEFKRYPKTIPDLRIIPPEASEDVTMELPLNTPACPDRVLHLDLTTPNLVHQPGKPVTMYDITDAPDVEESAVLSTEISALYYQPETYLRLGAPGSYTIAGDSMIELPNLRILHIYGPAIFTGGSTALSINLTRGGHIENEEGEIVQRIPPTPNYLPPDGITAPYYVITNEKTYLPPGLTLLTKKAGFIREPAAPPPP